MKNEEKEKLSAQTQKKYLWGRFKNGWKTIKEKAIAKIILLLYYPIIILIWKIGKNNLGLENMPLVSPVLIILVDLILPFLLIVGTILIPILFGTPIGFTKTKNEFRRIGMINRAGEVPILLSRTKNSKLSEVEILEFDSVGIPLSEWETTRFRIESALNVNVVKISEGKNKRIILLSIIDSNNKLSDNISWNDEYLIEDNSTLVFGKSIMGLVTVDIAKIPHILLGGSTGSGKSVLLKSLLMQSIKKGFAVYIADFKGGVDFPKVWHDKCTMCFKGTQLIEILTNLTNEIEKRKTLFREIGVANLNQYNKQKDKPLNRYIFACDEIAELLDKTGLSKEQKEKISLIENRLSIIARQGRAFGVHLILATQRPDANILQGQIRNNIDCRVCGRADTILSQIILDNTSAAEQIPKDTAGRFIMHDGTVFQAFWIDEQNL